MRWLVAFWCVCVAAAAASCTTKSRPSQLVPLTRMPAHPLAFGIFRLRNGPGRVCRTRILDAEYRNANTHESIAALTVSTHLAGATAFWLPGSSGAPCRSVRTAVPAGPARKIAALVNGAPTVPAGIMTCGMDDGSRVWLYLRPAHAHGVQKLILTPEGCLTISSAGLWPRYLPEAVMRALGPYAPPGWSAYTHHGRLN